MIRNVVLVLAACCLAGPSFGQLSSNSKSIEVTRREIQAKRRGIVEVAIDLTAEQSKQFWPLYLDWRAKCAGLDDRRLALIGRIDDSGNATDAQAKAMLDEWMKLEQEGLDLRKQYIKRFRKILPDKTVARFFQLEKKMDAVLDYDLAGRIPLLD